MATDGPTPPDCHPDAYNGVTVFATHSLGGLQRYRTLGEEAGGDQRAAR